MYDAEINSNNRKVKQTQPQYNRDLVNVDENEGQHSGRRIPIEEIDQQLALIVTPNHALMRKQSKFLEKYETVNEANLNDPSANLLRKIKVSHKL